MPEIRHWSGLRIRRYLAARLAAGDRSRRATDPALHRGGRARYAGGCDRGGAAAVPRAAGWTRADGTRRRRVVRPAVALDADLVGCADGSAVAAVGRARRELRAAAGAPGDAPHRAAPPCPSLPS